MDLGFGSSNQAFGEAASAAILQSTKAREEAVEAEIAKYDALLTSGEDELEQLRAKRLEQMKKTQKQREEWRNLGHGTYTELGGGGQTGSGIDCAKEFFEAAKKSEMFVVHFYRKTTRLCDVFHFHLEKLAPKHLETKFSKLDVEEEAPGVDYLVQKLGIVVMPTLLIVKKRKAHHQIRGFDELGGSEDFSTGTLAYVLGLHGAINCTGEEAEPPEELLGSAGVNSIRISKK